MTRTIVINRRNIKLNGGAGQLIMAQVKLLKNHSSPTEVWCSKGAFKFFLKTGIHPKLPIKSLGGLHQLSSEAYEDWLEKKVSNLEGVFIIDHDMVINNANVSFIHNSGAMAEKYLDTYTNPYKGSVEEYFKSLKDSTVIVANSNLVRDISIHNYNLDPGNIITLYPGYDAKRFNPTTRQSFRNEARNKLKLDKGHTLIGLTTSGDFVKRGLDTFFECAEKLAQEDPKLRFIVIGGNSLPEWAIKHPLIQSNKIIYKHKCPNPEYWMSAIDVFLYTARFEEFGIVVAESIALGIPTLTSKTVGASELIPKEGQKWVTETPSCAEFIDLVKNVINNKDCAKTKANAAMKAMLEHTHEQYSKRSISLVNKLLHSK